MAEDDLPTAQHLSDSLRFPVGTIALYGPDANKTTKIVAEILFDPHSESLRRSWVGSDVTTNPDVQDELAHFILEHQPACVLASEGNIACVHVAGEDYPLGEDCPFCPYWVGRPKGRKKTDRGANAGPHYLKPCRGRAPDEP